MPKYLSQILYKCIAYSICNCKTSDIRLQEVGFKSHMTEEDIK